MSMSYSRDEISLNDFKETINVWFSTLNRKANLLIIKVIRYDMKCFLNIFIYF